MLRNLNPASLAAVRAGYRHACQVRSEPLPIASTPSSTQVKEDEPGEVTHRYGQPAGPISAAESERCRSLLAAERFGNQRAEHVAV